MAEYSPEVERFLRYVSYDTQSKEDASCYPSTEKQKVLGNLLVDELRALGLKDAAMDEHGYVMATLESNLPDENIPVIGLIAHVDTSPEVSGKDVKPVIHQDYKGDVLQLSEEHSLNPKDYPPLKDCIGHTLISSDGTTLLGADDKAGIAEIMTAIERFTKDPTLPHGKVRIAFTVDEEVGTGTKHFSVKEFGADYAYTIDGGGTPGELENETFSADAAEVVFTGVNVHPGYAKDKMVSALKAASQFVALLPKDKTPETTDERVGFLHPVSLQGSVEAASIKMILRSFETEELLTQRHLVEDITSKVREQFPKIGVEIKFEESYRNMRLILDKHPKVMEMAAEAIKRAGLKPVRHQIRGGTDGSRLSYMGLPTPNIFTGGHLYHSRYEWVSMQVMAKSVDTLVELVKLWGTQKKD